MRQAHRDDTRIELSGPGQPELTDKDGRRGDTTTTGISSELLMYVVVTVCGSVGMFVV